MRELTKALFLLLVFENGQPQRSALQQGYTKVCVRVCVDRHTNTQLMEFTRGVDTVIKGEGSGIRRLRALERTWLAWS